MAQQTTHQPGEYTDNGKGSAEPELPDDLGRLAEMVRCGDLVPTPHDSPARRERIEAAIRHGSRWEK